MKHKIQIMAFLLLCSIARKVTATPEKLGRGDTCDPRRVSPKFKSSESGENPCDEARGLFCTDSENPNFTPQRQSAKICDCTEDYYFDSGSQECRIQIGLACDPDKANNESETWDNKCPSNGHCSSKLGRYGPRNARGMCRCNEGLVVSGMWFVGGGGTICEEENKVDEVEPDPFAMDSVGNSLST